LGQFATSKAFSALGFCHGGGFKALKLCLPGRLGARMFCIVPNTTQHIYVLLLFLPSMYLCGAKTLTML
jgi:hypothetical protein